MGVIPCMTGESFFAHLYQLIKKDRLDSHNTTTQTGGDKMSKSKYKLTHEEKRILVIALVELKNQMLEEGKITDPVDDLLIKFLE